MFLERKKQTTKKLQNKALTRTTKQKVIDSFPYEILVSQRVSVQKNQWSMTAVHKKKK